MHIEGACWRSIAHLAHEYPRSFAYSFTSATDNVLVSTSSFDNVLVLHVYVQSLTNKEMVVCHRRLLARMGGK